MSENKREKEEMSLREKYHEIIFEADTPAGKLFDVLLLWAILISVFVVIVESMPEFPSEYLIYLRSAEWGFTILFTVEYVLRIWSAPKPLKYVFSFFGIIDLLSIIPTYLSLIIPGSQFFLVVRGLRLLRVFRILRLSRYIGEAEVLRKALLASSAKITVFLGTVLTLVVIIGTLMYVVEGPENGFTSIPVGIYWAVVTLTTVGYGDISPQTMLGQFLAGFVMIVGYAIIAIPTGIVSVEMGKADASAKRKCPSCGNTEHTKKAKYCQKCGASLEI